MNTANRAELQLILNNVANHVSLQEDEVEFFSSLLEWASFNRREYLIRKGEVAKHTYFIIKGCIRNYQIDNSGNMHISGFAIEDWWISDLSSYITRQPAMSFVDAIEDTRVFRLSRNNYDVLMEKVPKFERYFRILHQNAFVAQNNRIMESISLTAEERYLNFLNKYPEFNLRFSQKQIAAYLGITPEFLSMLRSRMTKIK